MTTQFWPFGISRKSSSVFKRLFPPFFAVYIWQTQIAIWGQGPHVITVYIFGGHLKGGALEMNFIPFQNANTEPIMFHFNISIHDAVLRQKEIIAA